jgi:hypothetical protein
MVGAFLFQLTIRKVISIGSVLLGLIAGISWITNPYVQFWANSGMETTFFSLLLVSSLFVLIFYPSFPKLSTRSNSVICVLLLSVTTITRPEGSIVIFATISGLVLREAYQNKREKKKLTNISNQLAIYIFTVTFVNISVFIFNRLYYKSWLPNPISFKRHVKYYDSSPRQNLDEIFSYLLIRQNLLVLTLIALLLTYILIHREKVSFQSLLLALSTFTYLGINTFSAYSDYYRYQIPVSALIALLLVSVYLDSRNVKRRISTKISNSLLLLIVIALANTTFSELKKVSSTTSAYSYVQTARIEAGKYINSTYSKVKVLAGDSGALSFFSLDNTWVDSSGLTNGKLLKNVLTGNSYTQAIDQTGIVLLADTFTSSGISGSEEIYNSPLAYFNNVPQSVESGHGCKFVEIYKPKLVRNFSRSSSETLSIQIWELKKPPLKPLNCK